MLAWLVMLLLLAAPAPAAADRPDPGSNPVGVVREWDAALNAHDTQAAMALMAVGAAVQADRAPQEPDQVRGWIEQLIRENVQVDLIGSPQVDSTVSARFGAATNVTWHARLSMERFRLSGAPSVDATLGAVVVDSRLALLSLRPDPAWAELLVQPQ